MISEKYKCIFIEVPKTATTSIREILGFPLVPHLDIVESKREMLNNWPFNNYSRSSNRFGFINRLLPLEFKKRAVEKTFNSYFKFGFVRNPWDRIVSLYFRMEGIKMSDRITFDEFVNWIQNSSDTSIHASIHKNQLDWFLDENGKVAVDFIGKFENLREDYEIVKRKLGINSELPHANKRQKNNKYYAEYYNDKTKSIVAEKFKVDIEYFGYEFGK